MTDSAKTAAQKVVAAFLTAALTGHTSRQQLAAALRAAADEVVPVEPEPPALPFPSVNDPWPHWDTKQAIRRQLLAIAAELKGQPDA